MRTCESTGDLYIADSGNRLIRKVVSSFDYPTSQPSSQPSIPTSQPTNLPSSQPSQSWAGFIGFNQFSCATVCSDQSQSLLSLPVNASAHEWSSDTGGVYLLCSNCDVHPWGLDRRPYFGDFNAYTGNFVYLGSTSDAKPFDIRLSYTFQGVTSGNSYLVGFWQTNNAASDLTILNSWTVSLGGKVVYNGIPRTVEEYIHTESVVATTTSLTLVFEAVSTVYRTRSVMLNGITLMQPWTSVNYNFENIVSTTTFQYYAVGSTIGEWTTGGNYVVEQNAGVAIFSTQWSNFATPLPNNLQYGCWIQNSFVDVTKVASITRTLTGITFGSAYFVSFWHACRDASSYNTVVYCPAANTFTVQLGGTTVYSTSPSSLSWVQVTTGTKVATHMSMTLTFQLGGNTGGLDADIGIDAITVQLVTPTGQPTQQPSNIPSGQPSSLPTLQPRLKNGIPQIFNQAGTYAYIVPAGCRSMHVQLSGGSGFDYYGTRGGYGGYIKAIIAVTEGEILQVWVGGAGSGGIPGFNGGGASGGSYRGRGGGGASDLRTNSSLSSRIIVAGGGGGAALSGNGGKGGGWIGGGGWYGASDGITGGNGGSQTYGGARNAVGTVQSTSPFNASFGIGADSGNCGT